MTDRAPQSQSAAKWTEPVLWPSAPWGLALAGLGILLGILWLQWAPHAHLQPAAASLPHARELQPRQVVAAAAPVLADIACVAADAEAGRQVAPAAAGACPDPTVWRGQFPYTGQRLWFNLVRGDRTGYLVVTVAGQPASALNRRLSRPLTSGENAGYLPLLSPYEHAAMRPEREWVLIHEAATAGPHQVIYEIGAEDAIQPGDFIQDVGVDPAFAPGWPRSPGWLLLLGGLAALAVQWLAIPAWPRVLRLPVDAGVAIREFWRQVCPDSLPAQTIWALCGLLLAAAGIRQHLWWLSLPGLLGLGLLGLKRPAWWLGALLFGLPFYLHPVPLIPGFALNLVEIGVWGGAALALLDSLQAPLADAPHSATRRGRVIGLGLVLIALLAAVDAAFPEPALREWRTVFLAGFAFLLALVSVLQHSRQREQDMRLLLVLWIAGAVAIALFGLYSYWAGINITDVEGVRRIRGLYGSPNNLALYLERTALVCLALFVFATRGRRRWLWGLVLAIQGAALLLTFSKGALLLGVPAGILALLVITVRQARQWPDTRRALWLLGGAALLGIALLIPFLSTPRFAGLLDVRQSFPNLVRLHLWRSGIHMFLDHAWLGAGPDNFLYLYRGFYLAPAVWNEPSLNHPHNFFIDWLSRLGLPGLLGGIAFMATGMGLLYRRVMAIPSNRIALGFLAAAVAGLAHGQVDASFALPDIMLVWIFLFGLWCFPYPVRPPDPLLS